MIRFWVAILLALHFGGGFVLVEDLSAKLSSPDVEHANAPGSSCPLDSHDAPCNDDCGLCPCHPAFAMKPSLHFSRKAPQKLEAARAMNQDEPLALHSKSLFRPPRTA